MAKREWRPGSGIMVPEDYPIERPAPAGQPGLLRGEYIAYGTNPRGGAITTPVITNMPRQMAARRVMFDEDTPTGPVGLPQINTQEAAQLRGEVPAPGIQPGRGVANAAWVTPPRPAVGMNVGRPAENPLGLALSPTELQRRRLVLQGGAALPVNQRRQIARQIASEQQQAARAAAGPETTPQERALTIRGRNALAEIAARSDADVRRIFAEADATLRTKFASGELPGTAAYETVMADQLAAMQREAEAKGNIEMQVAAYKARATLGLTTTTTRKEATPSGGVTAIETGTQKITGEVPPPPVASAAPAATGEDADNNGVPDNARWTEPATGKSLDMNKVVNFLRVYESLEDNDPKKQEWAAQYEMDKKRKALWLASIGRNPTGE